MPNNRETFERPTGAQNKAPEKKAEGEKELKETSKQFIEGVSDVVDTEMESSEGIENAEVSENTGENRKKVSHGLKTSRTQAAKAALLKKIKLPSVKIMQAQIAKEIHKQIDILEKQAKRMTRNPAGFEPFKLNGVVSKIRELRDILSQLAHLTFEKLKSLWLKFVKSISI